MKFRLPVIATVLIALSTVALPARAELTPDEVRQTAADAYLYGHPLVDNYRIYYAFAVLADDTVTKAGTDPNSWSNFASPYRIASLDLRAEPLVVTLPPVGQARNWNLQLIDFYTRDFENLDAKTAPATGGRVLVAGPNWNGPQPDGIDGILRARSELALAVGQIRLAEPTDLESLPPLRPEFQIKSLSTYLGNPPPTPAHSIDYLEPLSSASETRNLEFYNELAFLLRFCPRTPDNATLRERLTKLGLLPGRPFGVVFMQAGEKAALTAGLAEGQRMLAARPSGKSFEQVFGTPSSFKNEDDSSTPASPDLSGLSDDGAFEIPFTVDSGGHLLDGSQGKYSLTFAPGQLPPAAQAWSLAMYTLPDQELVRNPIDRYFVGSTTLPAMVRASDGSLTISIQRDPPGGPQNTNWLPAPKGPFLMILRLYGAEEPALDNTWQKPRIDRLD